MSLDGGDMNAGEIEKRPLGRLWTGWEDNMKTHIISKNIYVYVFLKIHTTNTKISYIFRNIISLRYINL
jgi:hypothetical protein